MSNFINPLLVDGYVDDFVSESVQGCYIGDSYWDAERLADESIKRERNTLAYIKRLKMSIHDLKWELEGCKPHQNRRKECLGQQISKLETELKKWESLYQGTTLRGYSE